MFKPPLKPTHPQLHPAEPSAPASPGFTRVVVGDLKPDVLAALSDDEGALGVLRDLAHLYHYYIHGPRGNAFMWVVAGCLSVFVWAGHGWLGSGLPCCVFSPPNHQRAAHPRRATSSGASTTSRGARPSPTSSSSC
jgi:hypothetical protein